VKKTTTALVSAFAFLMLFAAVAPVLATPAQKIAFTVKSAPLPIGGITIVDTDTTPSGIIHTEATFMGTLFGATGTEASMFLGATVSGTNVQNVNGNTAKGEVKVHWTWHLTGGSFEGNFAGDVDGVGVTAALVNLHGVLQGTGAYSGWTIKVDGNKPAGLNPFAWTGTIIIP
jgi:hypothetical protein